MRARVFALVALAASTLAVGLAPASAQTSAAPQLTLVAQDAWTPPNGDVHFTLHVAGAAPGWSLNIVSHSVIGSRSTFTKQLANDQTLGSVNDQVIVPLDALPPDANGNRALTLGLESSGDRPERLSVRRPGVYPVEIEMRDADDNPQARLVTYVVLAAPTGSPDAIGSPLGVAWVWPLAAKPAIEPDGSADADVVAEMRANGRLGRQALALRRAVGVPLTIVPGPETIQSWDTVAGNDKTVADGIAAIHDALGANQMVPAPFVPIDLPSLLRLGMTAAVDNEFVAGDDALQRFFGAQLDNHTALARPVDTATVGRLRAGGADRLIVNNDALTARSTRLTPARPFALDVGPSLLQSGPVSAIASDGELAGLLSGDAPPALRAQRFLAALSVVAFEDPSEPRAVTIVNPSGFDPPDALLDAVTTGLRSNPILHPMTVDQVFTQVPADMASDGTPVTRTLAPYVPPAPPVTPARFDLTSTRLTAFHRFAPDYEGMAAADQALLESVSSSWSESAGDANRGEAELNAVNSAIDAFLARIEVPKTSKVTLTDRSGNIPLTFRNETGTTVTVLIKLQSPKLSFPGPDGAQQTVVLKPRNTTVVFPVAARTSGSFPLRLTLSSADGALPIAQTQFRVSAHAVSTVGLVLLVSAGVFLVLWWLLHIRRERTRRARAVPAT